MQFLSCFEYSMYQYTTCSVLLARVERSSGKVDHANAGIRRKWALKKRVAMSGVAAS